MPPTTLRTLPLRRPFLSRPLRPLIAIAPRRFAHEGYGGGEGDPKAEKPKEQGANPSEHLEHPGPPPPDVGQGKESGSQSNTDPSNAGAGKQGGGQGGKTGGGEASQGDKQSVGESVKAKTGAQPKLNTVPKGGQDSAEVKAHNEEMDSRKAQSDNPGGGEEDKVGKGFWKGTGGVDPKA